MPPRANLRLVVDTNVLISSLISIPMMAVIRLAVQKHIVLFSVEILKEFKDVMDRPKLKGRIIDAHKNELTSSLLVEGELILVTRDVNICRDPFDDHLLAFCKDGKADLLITGDKDLLVLKKFGRTRIVAPAQFLEKHQ